MCDLDLGLVKQYMVDNLVTDKEALAYHLSYILDDTDTLLYASEVFEELSNELELDNE